MNRRRSWIAFPAVALCVAALGAAVVFVILSVSLTESPNVADAVAVALAAVGCGAAALGAAWKWAAARATRPDQVSAAKNALVALVRNAWRVESVIRGLEPRPDSGGLAAHRQHRPAGGPGAGKTTLAIQLLLELTGKGRDPADPVPVLLSLSSWDPAAEDLHSWLNRSLERDYEALGSAEFGSGVALELVRDGHILPVMDGLDELPPPAPGRDRQGAQRLSGRGGVVHPHQSYGGTGRGRRRREAAVAVRGRHRAGAAHPGRRRRVPAHLPAAGARPRRGQASITWAIRFRRHRPRPRPGGDAPGERAARSTARRQPLPRRTRQGRIGLRPGRRP
ncbi:hypothetical protein OG320_20060 [Microbispora sp. NBC_01189]|uniref:hypothetical protein n=1 Tax=Microbispora sp. NBC_01189 TaxID=2903583 RepID=UPI002E101E05|nr:hypothetical protein OG320_20060 [Microbispora sp. NBC_01189]